MNDLTTFSADYATARRRFREAAARLGWNLEAHAIAAAGPDGEELTIDVGLSSDGDPDRVLVLSSGLHGAEACFGSAVQIALLEQWAVTQPPAVRCLFLHGLNPFGFAWGRRFNEQNIDPNRNFLLPGEPFAGAPKGYAALDPFLNPRRPPSSWEPFTLKALWRIARHGMPALRQAIAAGQYEFPQGLFYGGSGPSATQQVLSEHLAGWLGRCAQVVHLDFHTGLGAWGAWKLLIDYPLSEQQHGWLTEWFGADAFEACAAGNVAYDARGGFGQWCVAQGLAADYLFACAEFGTYGPLRVLSSLRAENQAHHWGAPDAAATIRAKAALREMFCPASPAWRSQALQQSLDLVNRALEGLDARARNNGRC